MKGFLAVNFVGYFNPVGRTQFKQDFDVRKSISQPDQEVFEVRTWSEWLAARYKAMPARNGKRKSAAAQGQLSLF
jgi:hypothetical protein